MGLQGIEPVIALREKERVIGVCQYRQRIDRDQALRALESLAASRDKHADSEAPIEGNDIERQPSLSGDVAAQAYKTTLDQMKLLPEEPDGVDAAGKGATANGSDPGASDDD